VGDPSSVAVPAGGAFFLRKASGSSFEQWRPPLSVVTDGLTLFLDAGNPDSYPGSGTTWKDLSGNGNNGTLLNGVGYNSGNGGSLVFDGTNDQVSTSLTSSNSYTWNAWFRTNVVSFGQSVGYKNIISINNNYMLMLLDQSTNNMGFWTPDGLGGQSLNMGPIFTNTWYYATFVREGNNITNGYKTYMNGSFRGSTNTGSWSSSNHIFIGGREGLVQFLNGNISQVSIYNRALTPTEIRQNYNATKGRYEVVVQDGLVLHLDAGNTSSYNGTGTLWRDMSGNNYNGTLTNAPTYSSENGGSIVFDGTNDHVTISSNLSTIVGASLPATWSAWVNVSSSTSNRMIIGSAWANGGAHMRLTGTTHAPADRVRFLYFSDGSNGTGVDSVATFTSGWQNFVVTYNGQGTSHSNFKMYVNGQQVSVTDPTFGSPTSVRTVTNFSIGAAAAENAAYYNSNISQVSIYNRVLTDEEILRNFNVHKGRYGL
jgi:hypothetical protein